MLVPFGKFFNNQVAMAFNMTAVGPILHKIFGGQKNKTSEEVWARGLVAFGVFWAVSDAEKINMDKGLAWNEEIDPVSGEVLDQQYSFPYGAIKAFGRLVAHWRNDEEIPADLLTALGTTYLGQITRGLSSSNQGIAEVASALASADGKQIVQVLKDTLGSIPAQAVSGATRPLEPLNALAGIARKEQYYTPDRKQGMKVVNQATRYIDQVVALVTGGTTGPQAYNTYESKTLPQPTRLLTPTRTTTLTSTEQVLNAIGKPGWKGNMKSDSPEADNRYNKIFFDIVESGSRALWDRPQFKSGTLEYKQSEVTKLYASARKSTLDYMNRLGANSGDSTLAKMIDVSTSYPAITIERTMKDLKITKDIGEMSFEELTTLETALKVRDDWVHRGG